MTMPKARQSLPLRDWELWKRARPHTVFLLIASTLGLAVLGANAPFQAPDENAHFHRAFQLSEGTVVGQRRGDNAGGQLPEIVIQVADTEGIAFHYEKKMTAALFRKKLDPAFVEWSNAPRAFGAFAHTVVYPPVGYAPQALAIIIGKLAHVGPLGLMYFARLGGLAASICLGYYALRRMPVYRWSCLLFLLGPMSLYLMGSIAPDGILVGGAFLLMALVLSLGSGNENRVTWQKQLAVVALGAVLATAKLVYLPVAAVATFLVLPHLGRGREKTIFSVASVVGYLLPVWMWGRVIAAVYVPGRTDIPIDPVAQLHFVAGAPLFFLSLVASSINEQFVDVYHWFVGVLGWGDTPVPFWFYSAYGFGLLACILAESCSAAMVKGRQRLIMIAGTVTAVFLIYGAQYASWNSPGSHDPIEGIEGRYFLPLAPLVVLSIPRFGEMEAPTFIAPMLGIVFGALSALVCLWAVVARYYL